MIDFLGDVVGFCMDIAHMALTLCFDVAEFALGILGGVASMVFVLAGFVLLAVLIGLFIRRRISASRRGQLVDENGETFTSYYRQEAE